MNIAVDRSAFSVDTAADVVVPPEDFGPSLSALTRLLFVTPEMGDFVKAGGLGEVSSALPRQLRSRCDVRVLIPGYRAVRDAARALDVVREMPATAGLPAWSLGRFSTDDGLTIYTVLCDALYDREGSPYGVVGGGDFTDNDTRFARLCLAAAELAAGEADPNWKPDIVHVNDWPSALVPGYLRWKGLSTPSILTVHNLAYQGLYAPDRMGALAIPDRAFGIHGVEFHGKVSFLKAGIYYASHVTTVSETYAREIVTPDHGCGLDGLLRTRMDEGRVSGILNGIDDNGAPRKADDATDLSQWKAQHAADIRRAFDLPDTPGPLFAIISRLVHQKGIDLAVEAAETIIANGGQLIVTGRGEARMEQAVADLARRYPMSVSARIGFDNDEAQRMFAASDFLLMPSRFEPCGLSQMYAQRVGTLPIASRTGGLVDTIDDGQSGFLFSSLTGAGLASAVTRAFEAFRSGQAFGRMRRHAAAKRFDWSQPTRRYAALYAQALAD